MSAAVLSESDGGIARLTFNRPERLNAIDTEMAEAFEAALDTALSNSATRVVLLTGAGRGFMAGGDVHGMKAAPDRAAFLRSVIDPMHRAILRLAESPVLSIAAAQGPVAGAGLSLCLATDFLIAAQGARFEMAYARLGTTPDCGGTWALTRLVGPRRALQMTLDGVALDADEALRIGIAGRVVPDAELDAEVHALAERLVAGPREAQARGKVLIAAAAHVSLADQLDAEATAFLACAATRDFDEGLDAFLARRKPHFGQTGSPT